MPKKQGNGYTPEYKEFIKDSSVDFSFERIEHIYKKINSMHQTAEFTANLFEAKQLKNRSLPKFKKTIKDNLKKLNTNLSYRVENINYSIEVGMLSDLGNSTGPLASAALKYGGRSRGIRDIFEATRMNTFLVKAALNNTRVGKTFLRKVGALVSYRIADNFRRQKDSTGADWPKLKDSNDTSGKAKLSTGTTVGRRKKQGAAWRHPTIKQMQRDGTLDEQWVKKLKKKDSKSLSQTYHKYGVETRHEDIIQITQKQNYTTGEFEEVEEVVDTKEVKVKGYTGYARSREALSDYLGTKAGKSNRKRAPETKVKRQGKHSMPLIDTGELFTELVGNASRSIGGEFDFAKDMGRSRSGKSVYRTSANAVMSEQPFGIRLSYRGGLRIEPNRGLSKRTKLLIGVHNKPVSSYTVVGRAPKTPGGKRPRVPGREFLYLQESDRKFIMKAMVAIILAGGGDQRTVKKEDGGYKKITVNVRNNNISKKAYKDIGDVENQQALLGQMMRMGLKTNMNFNLDVDEASIFSQATFDFIDETRSANKAIRDRVRKVTGKSLPIIE